MLRMLKVLAARVEDFIRAPNRQADELPNVTARGSPGPITLANDQPRAHDIMIASRAPEGP
jgi:hypothetical protein